MRGSPVRWNSSRPRSASASAGSTRGTSRDASAGRSPSAVVSNDDAMRASGDHTTTRDASTRAIADGPRAAESLPTTVGTLASAASWRTSLSPEHATSTRVSDVATAARGRRHVARSAGVSKSLRAANVTSDAVALSTARTSKALMRFGGPGRSRSILRWRLFFGPASMSLSGNGSIGAFVIGVGIMSNPPPPP